MKIKDWENFPLVPTSYPSCTSMRAMTESERIAYLQGLLAGKEEKSESNKSD